MLVKRKYFLLILVAAGCLFIFGFGSYYLFTARGSNSLVRFAVSRYLKSESFTAEGVTGNLLKGLVYESISLRNLKSLPQGSVLEAKKVNLGISFFNLKGLTVKIDNATLRIPGLDIIFFYGSLKEESLDFNVYSKNLAIQGVLNLFGPSPELSKLSGIARDLDLRITGPLLEPKITGTLLVEKLYRNGFSASNCPFVFDLQLKGLGQRVKLYGQLSAEKAVISGKRTAVINLQKSKAVFEGDYKKPVFEIKGASTVEKVKINITLRGRINEFDLKLTSKPALPQEKILFMLATGKRWAGSQRALEQRKISAELAADFLDYLVLGGQGSKIAQFFGLSDLSVQYDKKTKGLGIKKDISDKLGASYYLEESTAKEGKSSLKHKIGGDYKVTEHISLGAEQEFKKEENIVSNQTESNTSGKVTLQYKKEF
ncbi:MAG: translocation/assembly module TamB [Candidatus Omnitrophica bacterium]|nr:translocation/assembly module TamB [Candidatus Omnitrophota bacterium]MBU2044361.1 translocation/assembly module TamB [Candidatus Omnitrophota bacterium]MBU2265768.1 translocation/assembly module TamB [Candidatus Omnitrophota bacterium]MBU2473794.1 translocation/assembly module TamB [Candidatus Omnitrophota bacterium]